MKKILFFVFISTILFSCGDAVFPDDYDGIPPCEKNNTCELSVINHTSDPYSIWLDGAVVATVRANSTTTYTCPAGIVSLTVKQNSGYVLYPTVIDYNPINAAACSEWTFTITE